MYKIPNKWLNDIQTLNLNGHKVPGNGFMTSSNDFCQSFIMHNCAQIVALTFIGMFFLIPQIWDQVIVCQKKNQRVSC